MNPSTEQPQFKEIGNALQLLHDPAFRHQVRAQEPDALATIGYAPLKGDEAEGEGEYPEIRVVTSTQDTTYIQMPPNVVAGKVLSDDQMRQIQAAGSAGSASTVGTVGSMSTLATATSTASTASSMSSLGSAGSGGSSGCSGGCAD